jgi:hypothetical protein
MMNLGDPRLKRATRAAFASLAALVILGAACGPSTIRVVGIMQKSSDMRPLPSVPLGGYQQLHLLVRAASGQSAERSGTPDCGYTRLEGTDEGQDLKNAACVPPEAMNTAIGIVRQRLRSYGITVARESSEPYDYTVEVSVTGEAPKRPDRMLVKAIASVTFKLHDGSAGTLIGSVDRSAAAAAFDSIARTCALQHADLSNFSASSAQAMTPDFDIQALASNAVDSLLRCYDLANFFLEARNRYPKPAPELSPEPTH